MALLSEQLLSSYNMAVEVTQQFDKAKIANLERARLALTDKHVPDTVERGLDNLLTTLYGLLRSPVFPKNGYRYLIDALTQKTGEPTVNLYGMLATDTAAREFPTYIKLHKLFTKHGIRTKPHVLIIHWPKPNIIRELQRAETLTYPMDNPMQSHFEQEFNPILQQWIGLGLPVESLAGWPIEFIKTEKRTPYASGGFRNPPPEIERASRELHQARRQTLTGGQQFYNSHPNLSLLGADQRDFAEVFRRATGIWIKEQSEKTQHPSLWMATERTSTLLKNYNVPENIAGLNLNVE